MDALAGLDRGPFTALLLENGREQAGALATLLAGLDGPEVRVIRVGNPLRSPLTLERIMIQVAGPEGEVFLGDDPRLLVRAIADRQREEARVVLVIEQAESLHPKVLRSLQQMAPHFSQAERPALQVVFVGRPAFRALLNGDDLKPLREALWPVADVAAPKPAVADPPPMPARGPVAEPEVLAAMRAQPAVQAAAQAMARSSQAAPAIQTTPTIQTTPAVPAPPATPAVAAAPPAQTAPASRAVRVSKSELDIPPLRTPSRPVAPRPAEDLEKYWSDDWVEPAKPTPDSPAASLNPAPRAIAAPVAGPQAARVSATAPGTAPWRARLLIPLLLLLAVSAGAVGAYFGLRGVFYRDVPARQLLGSTAPAAPTQPVPFASAPATPPPAPGPTPPQNAQPQAVPVRPVPPNSVPFGAVPSEPASQPSPTADQAARLRRDFDAFLNRSGRNVAALSEAQRGVLFDEFLEWRSQNAPPAPPSAEPRVVIHVPASSPEADALSAHLLTSLGARPGTVQTRRVPETPNRPSIRYFHPADEPAARQIAASMADTGLTWTLRDFSSFQPRPSRGTIEVWLPGRP